LQAHQNLSILYKGYGANSVNDPSDKSPIDQIPVPDPVSKQRITEVNGAAPMYPVFSVRSFLGDVVYVLSRLEVSTEKFLISGLITSF
jgi:hypothetical protein